LFRRVAVSELQNRAARPTYNNDANVRAVERRRGIGTNQRPRPLLAVTTLADFPLSGPEILDGQRLFRLFL
jgi:hypothetical protein